MKYVIYFLVMCMGFIVTYETFKPKQTYMTREQVRNMPREQVHSMDSVRRANITSFRNTVKKW